MQTRMEINKFILFEEGPNERTRDRLHVTISSRGRLYFNPIALEEIGRPPGVVLMYDEVNKAIGVLPGTMTRKETFRLRKLRASNGMYITALNFCRRCSIAPSETLAFQTPRINHDGILVLSLNHVQPVTRGRRMPCR